ncbi:hypothetical protein AVEN_188178-1 [Araneus ventricosus]|uniref:Uncharacterized protein n=1 Tax=Araneus ventricosus TaxID=182803 RepID=A0A4Y2MSF2_ARAVE|nr:hypothetical protein AVEN_7284-1 [Araneus ventricosus]GBN29254.1 hypothetical protein AVEN_41532-1 [Araneus ventricosus]GBN29292.1 hypothetical protein AVEN_122575-1 [Araneus ventricosus]GBN29332.1 hypothetical protein AVEN_188178-1 [Araneus ventricosus]
MGRLNPDRESHGYNDNSGIVRCGIIKGDDIWVPYFTPDTESTTMTWKHPSLSVTKKFKMAHSAEKVELAEFWDA